MIVENLLSIQVLRFEGHKCYVGDSVLYVKNKVGYVAIMHCCEPKYFRYLLKRLNKSVDKL